MSGWQLGLALFGVLLTGFGLGITAVWLYARHVFRSKFGALASALTASTTTTTSGRVAEYTKDSSQGPPQIERDPYRR